MAKKKTESVYRVIGTSPVSWEEAAKNAVETAAKALRDLRVAEVCKLDRSYEVVRTPSAHRRHVRFQVHWSQ
ncbi:dodecin family protein [Paraburkholderia sp. SIMBA_049]